MSRVIQAREVALVQIKIDPRARKDVGDIRELRNSIESQGLLQPIILDGDLTLVAGERRLTACTELGWKTISAHIIPGLTADNKLIIELIENTTRKEFEWPEEIDLRTRIHKMYLSTDPKWTFEQTAEKIGCSKATMSRDLDLQAAIDVFPTLMECKTKRQAAEEYKRLKQRGRAVAAMEMLGEQEAENFKALLEDKLAAPGKSSTPSTIRNPLPQNVYHIGSWQSILPQLPSCSIGLVELDPPYAINYHNTYGQTAKTKTTLVDWSPEEYSSNMEALLTEIKPFLLPDTWLLLWAGIDWNEWIITTGTRLGYRVQRPGIWCKKGGAANAPGYNLISNYEMYYLLAYGKPNLSNALPAAFLADAIPGAHKIHPTEKPLKEVYGHLFSALAQPGSLFFAPFAGSGNSMIAAAQAGMTPIGCDIKPDYRPQYLIRLQSTCITTKERSNALE